MTRSEFRHAYRVARWTLKNRPLRDLAVGLPRDRYARQLIVEVLLMAGLLDVPGLEIR
jgi:hypothetical protein